MKRAKKPKQEAVIWVVHHRGKHDAEDEIDFEAFRRKSSAEACAARCQEVFKDPCVVFKYVRVGR